MIRDFKHAFILALLNKNPALKKDELKANKTEYIFYSLLILVSDKKVIIYGKNYLLNTNKKKYFSYI